MHAPLVSRAPLPWGDAGTWFTVRTMRRLARSEAADPLVVGTAAYITQHASGVLHTTLAIRRWLAGVTVFRPDPEGIELVRSPVAALLEIREHGVLRGDCDDVAVLAAGLALACQLPVRYRVLGWTAGGHYGHVLAEVWDGHGWIDLDVTRPQQAGMMAPPVREAAITV